MLSSSTRRHPAGACLLREAGCTAAATFGRCSGEVSRRVPPRCGGACPRPRRPFTADHSAVHPTCPCCARCCGTCAARLHPETPCPSSLRAPCRIAQPSCTPCWLSCGLLASFQLPARAGGSSGPGLVIHLNPPQLPRRGALLSGPRASCMHVHNVHAHCTINDHVKHVRSSMSSLRCRHAAVPNHLACYYC